MTLQIDLVHDSPIPLYHQIAEAIRYRIATGTLRPGAVLPPLREASTLWGANLHTIRRAYVELAREGLVATEVPRGTVVLPQAGRKVATGTSTPPVVGSFVERVLREAREKHRLTPDQLIDLLSESRPTPATARPVVYVTECSETQSADLAAQLMDRWRVGAVPWPLGRPAPPGRGPVIATYFHYADIRETWAARIGQVRFLGIRPDPAIRAQLEQRLGRRRKRTSVVFCEREESMLHNIAADLRRMLPPERFRIVPRLMGKPASFLSSYRGDSPVLFSPRLWGDLPPASHHDSRVLEARYVFEPKDLEEIGSTLRWRKR